MDQEEATDSAAPRVLDSESIRKFVVVAEELRFGRAAGLPGLPLPRWPSAGGGYPDGAGPRVRAQAQLLSLVARGRAAAVLPESVRVHLGRDLAPVPVPDAPPVTTVIAWPPHSRSRAVAGLVRVATRL